MQALLSASHDVPFGRSAYEQVPAPPQTPAALHFGGAGHVTPGPLHTPPVHVSGVVHELPSLHVVPFDLGVLEHVPSAGLQTRVLWHWSAAGHTTGFDPTQPPPEHWSVCVQAFPSSQGIELFEKRQPLARPLRPGLQVSVVQRLLSLQAPLFGVNEQTPDELQASMVHDLPSLHVVLQQNPPAQTPGLPFAKRQSELNEQLEPGPLE